MDRYPIVKLYNASRDFDGNHQTRRQIGMNIKKIQIPGQCVFNKSTVC